MRVIETHLKLLRRFYEVDIYICRHVFCVFSVLISVQFTVYHAWEFLNIRYAMAVIFKTAQYI